MKFTTAVTTLALATSVSAFAPVNVARQGTSLNSAVESTTYTFTKSEEIFAEAQEVSYWQGSVR